MTTSKFLTPLARCILELKNGMLFRNFTLLEALSSMPSGAKKPTLLRPSAESLETMVCLIWAKVISSWRWNLCFCCPTMMLMAGEVDPFCSTNTNLLFAWERPRGASEIEPVANCLLEF